MEENASQTISSEKKKTSDNLALKHFDGDTMFPLGRNGKATEGGYVQIV